MSGESRSMSNSNTKRRNRKKHAREITDVINMSAARFCMPSRSSHYHAHQTTWAEWQKECVPMPSALSRDAYITSRDESAKFVGADFAKVVPYALHETRQMSFNRRGKSWTAAEWKSLITSATVAAEPVEPKKRLDQLQRSINLIHLISGNDLRKGGDDRRFWAIPHMHQQPNTAARISAQGEIAAQWQATEIKHMRAEGFIEKWPGRLEHPDGRSVDIG